MTKLDRRAVVDFFTHRASMYDPKQPYRAVMYQDNNPQLADQRDRWEKKTSIPLLELRREDRVLEIGCGVGRWADELAHKVCWYHGTDLFESLVGIASNRLRGKRNVTFQAIGAEEITPDNLDAEPPFDVFIMAGVLMYVNDDGCRKLVREVASVASVGARVLVREPIGLEGRLTLDRVWSEELQSRYSAIYRSHEEMVDLFAPLMHQGFSLTVDRPLFPPELNNRAETRQHLFLLKREGRG